MSYYSDWKCGAIDDDEYAFAANFEAARDKAAVEKMENCCEHLIDGVCELGFDCRDCE